MESGSHDFLFGRQKEAVKHTEHIEHPVWLQNFWEELTSQEVPILVPAEVTPLHPRSVTQSVHHTFLPQILVTMSLVAINLGLLQGLCIQ